MLFCKYLYHVRYYDKRKRICFFSLQIIFHCVPIDREIDYFVIMKSPQSFYFTPCTPEQSCFFFVIYQNAVLRTRFLKKLRVESIKEKSISFIFVHENLYIIK